MVCCRTLILHLCIVVFVGIAYHYCHISDTSFKEVCLLKVIDTVKRFIISQKFSDTFSVVSLEKTFLYDVPQSACLVKQSHSLFYEWDCKVYFAISTLDKCVFDIHCHVWQRHIVVLHLYIRRITKNYVKAPIGKYLRIRVAPIKRVCCL